ncbi:hypothetical protein RFI_00202, partial [Reticulomyxa filosa]
MSIKYESKQPQLNFPEIDEEIISRAWNCCDEDMNKTSEVLHFIHDNSTRLEHQQYLLLLWEDFGNRVDKTIILNIWKQCNEIYYETRLKLEEICSSCYVNSCCTLREHMQRKCKQLSANFHQTIGNAEYNLQNFGFEKVNNKDWYYLRDIQILYLWNCYRKWINTQLIYKTKLNIPEKIFMLRNGKWKEYEIAFDYEYRRIVLFDNVKLKVKSLQVGNPKKLSLEFNVHIQWYNDLSD